LELSFLLELDFFFRLTTQTTMFTMHTIGSTRAVQTVERGGRGGSSRVGGARLGLNVQFPTAPFARRPVAMRGEGEGDGCAAGSYLHARRLGGERSDRVQT
jgi:hypothetical protein